MGRLGRWRASLTAVLLLVSLATTALLAMQAHANFLYHRGTAEQVLRDFARMAANEFIRRASARLGYDGYAVLLSAAARRLSRDGLPSDLGDALASHEDARVRAASSLALRFFAAAPGKERLAFTPDGPSREAQLWLLTNLKRRREEAGPFSVAHGSAHSFAFASARGPGDWEVIGFEIDPEQLGAWLAPTLERGPLLPSFVGHGQVTNASLFVSFRDQAGVERLRTGSAAWPLGVDVAFGDFYSGVLDGARVKVAIDPAAARQLIVGGLPQSRLPLVLGLLGLSTGLVLIALLQLRRERALQRLRSEFVANVSHELRTPLTQIRMFAETLLLDRVRSADERRRGLQIIDREARRLTHLVENVLQFSRGERGTLAVSRAPRLLAPLLREVLEQFQPLADGAGARVILQLDETATAAVDADALRQVLLNLLDNAVKYGGRGQQLIVALERGDGVLRLSVDDQGPGIPARERRRVFERYARLERDQRAAVAGTGIGLAVVADLMERHGGRAFVEDGSRGGARVVVELPA